MLREDIVFGPIKSRRLGRSLGINLLPEKGKICNFDCIYCECGWNSEGLSDTRIPNAAAVRNALEDKLCQCMLEGVQIDSITFSGDGEPTLNPDFARIIDDTIILRNTFYPSAKISVLSNATRLHKEDVFQALRKVDQPILKLDAPDNTLAAIINRCGKDYDVNRVIEGMERFQGNFILQTMFLKCKDFDSLSPAVLEGWKAWVRLLHPRQIMAYTISRPTPLAGIEAYEESAIREALQDLLDEGFSIQIKGK